MNNAGEKKQIFENLNLTSQDFGIYYLDGIEVARDKKLENTINTPHDQRKDGKYEPLIIDFKNILILRLLGQNDVFNFVRLEPGMTLNDVKSKINYDDIHRISEDKMSDEPILPE